MRGVFGIVRTVLGILTQVGIPYLLTHLVMDIAQGIGRALAIGL